MTKYIYPYNDKSKSVVNLANAMNIKRIKRMNSAFVGGPGKEVINWGSSQLPEQVTRGSRIINTPETVELAADKLRTFKNFAQYGDAAPRFPSYTTSLDTAVDWLRQGKFVFARTMLRGHSGAGISIMDPEHEDTWYTRAPLYVLYVPKKEEYRVHIVSGNVIDTQRKGLQAELVGREDVNFKVRNLANGFIYARNNINPPEDITVQALKAMAVSGLDFGAVDVIYNEQQRKAYVLEINTAPGLTGTTVENYANALALL